MVATPETVLPSGLTYMIPVSLRDNSTRYSLSLSQEILILPV